jgi:hypothetical protein
MARLVSDANCIYRDRVLASGAPQPKVRDSATDNSVLGRRSAGERRGFQASEAPEGNEKTGPVAREASIHFVSSRDDAFTVCAQRMRRAASAASVGRKFQ